MIAALKSFFNPETQKQMYERVAGTLIACIALLFVMLAVQRYSDVQSSIYVSDGRSVLKITVDDRVVIYQPVR